MSDKTSHDLPSLQAQAVQAQQKIAPAMERLEHAAKEHLSASEDLARCARRSQIKISPVRDLTERFARLK
jgi:hypothetical protein